MKTRSKSTSRHLGGALLAGAALAAAAIWLVRRARTRERHGFIDATNLDTHADRHMRRSIYADQPLSEPA